MKNQKNNLINDKKERLQKILSQAGIISRRKAEELIKLKKVTINDKVALIGDKASFNDKILIDNVPIFEKEEKVYYLLNKPKKTISSVFDPQKRKTVIDLIHDKRKLFPVGRLDWNTTGTLLITNDGEMSNRLIHPKYEIERIYRARINEKLLESELKFLNSNNVYLKEKKSKQKIIQVDKKTYTISLFVGSFHHIKNLFKLVNKKVIKLTRIEFAGLSHIGNLSKGEYRILKSKEIKWLKNLTNLNK